MLLYSICLSLSDLFQLILLAWYTPNHPCCCKWQNFILLLWLSHILLCTCVCVCIHTHIYIYTYPTSFLSIHVDGHFHCFLSLAIINNATMNIRVHESFPISVSVFVIYISRNGIAGSPDCFPGGSDGKESACNAGGLASIPGLVRSLETEMGTHSSILTWRIPWTVEPGRLQSMGSQRVRQDWMTNNFHFLP